MIQNPRIPSTLQMPEARWSKINKWSQHLGSQTQLSANYKRENSEYQFILNYDFLRSAFFFKGPWNTDILSIYRYLVRSGHNGFFLFRCWGKKGEKSFWVKMTLLPRLFRPFSFRSVLKWKIVFQHEKWNHFILKLSKWNSSV